MPAVTIGNAAERRTLAEAVRAAILTVHAAAGLASCADQQTQRLLRASEGLSRSALAVLLAAPPDTSPQQPRAPKPDDAPRKRRRPRGKRGNRGPKVSAMDEDDTTAPEHSGSASALPAAAATPGPPRGALVASGETDNLEHGKRQKVGFEVGRACRPLRTGPATADAECALEDGWADTPGASCPVSAVVAPPAPSGTGLTSPTAALAVQELQRLYQAQRCKDPGLDEIFVLFISFVLCNSRFAAEFNWDAVSQELQLWKQEDGTGLAALDEMLDMFGRSKRERLAQLLEPWLSRWQVAASQARRTMPGSPYMSQFG